MAQKKRGTKRAPARLSGRTLRMGRQRRLVLSAEICEAAGLSEGDTVEAEVGGDGTIRLHVRARGALLSAVQQSWAAVPTSSRKLIAQRRKEARRERGKAR